MRKLLDGKGVAEQYGLPEPTLRTMRVRGGGIPFLKVGARCLYRVEDIEAWLDARRFDSTAAVAAAGGR